MGGQSVAISMNELSNHDHSRFLTRTNRTVGRTNTLGPEAANNNVNKAVFKEAVVMQMTLPGAPTVYYGDEAGVCGFTDPDNRRTSHAGILALTSSSLLLTIMIAASSLVNLP